MTVHPNEIGQRVNAIIFIGNVMYIKIMYVKFNNYGADNNLLLINNL